MWDVRIDGSVGEGGGQILRSSLALAALTEQSFEIENIRGGRSKPGLLRQHLASVKAAARICSAQVEGMELGSTSLRFRPGPIVGGHHRFSVGSAGSACLVAQTVLPMLLRAVESTTLELEGGTHNPNAPSADFLQWVFLPVLGRLGAEVSLTLERPGFYPAGGGRVRMHIAPRALHSAELLDGGDITRTHAWALVSNLPREIAERELRVVQKRLGLSTRDVDVREVESAGPGNAVAILFERMIPELISSFGSRGRRAEHVAADAVAMANAYLQHGAPVGEHLADQLMLPLLTAGGSFCTGPLSRHAHTNIDVIERFTGARIDVEARGTGVIVTVPALRL